MCLGCLYEYTDAPVINDRVTAVADLIRGRGDDARYSSLLHLIVDDMNVDDHWLSLSTPYQQETYPHVEQWERDIYDGLAALTEAERATAVALAWGYDLSEGAA